MKAYTLARQDLRNSETGQRIRCLFFLATPHRGSDFAILLNNILRATGVLSTRPYIADLQRNSVSAQKINRDFEMYAQDVALWSFFETLKTSLGVTSSMIVDRDSAILGRYLIVSRFRLAIADPNEATSMKTSNI